jgi:hypothetical protein
MNHFYLAAGILSLILSAAHAIWGQSQVMPDLNSSNAAQLTKIAAFIVWHQITGMLFVSGIALITFAIKRTISGAKIAAALILCLVVMNFAIFIITGAVWMPELLTQSVPQHVMFTGLIVLLIMGLRRQEV